MKNFYLIILAVAVIGGGVLFFAIRGGTPAVEPVELGELDNAELIELAQPAHVFGDPDAPMTIMEFADYQCNGCMRFAVMVKPEVDAAYISTGKAKLVFHDFPLMNLHAHAFLAARAARCAGDQERYAGYHDLVFATQNEWSTMESATGHFKDLAEQLDLDTRTFNDCLDSDRHADVVTANMRLGQAFGVDATPTLFVHPGAPPVYRLGGARFLDIQEALESGGPEN